VLKACSELLWKDCFLRPGKLAYQYRLAPDDKRVYFYYPRHIAGVLRRRVRQAWQMLTQDRRARASASAADLAERWLASG
jgi:hypothetical protein